MTYQNGTEWEVWLSRDDGTRLALLDFAGPFEFTPAVNWIGRFRLPVALPESVPSLAAGSFASAVPLVTRSLFAKDRRINFWRKPEGGAMMLAFVGLIRRFQTRTNAAGLTVLMLSGPDLNDLLRRRIVAYAAGSAQAAMTAAADSLITEVVKDNLGSDAAAARQISSTYFSVAASPAAGPTITKGFAYRNVMDVLREVADAARQAGTYLFFGIVPTGESTFEFRTRTGEWGRDRTSDSGAGLIFGLEYGNLDVPDLDEDATEEVNFAYGLGRGEESDRNVQTSEDTTRSGASIFARAEAAANAVHETTDAGVTDVADARVLKGRPINIFTGNLQSVPGAVYGKDWDHGDRVTLSYAGRQFDALVRAVTVAVDENGRERIAGTVLEALGL